MSAATLRIAVPAPSFVPHKIIEQLQFAADEHDVESQLETYVARSTRFDPIRVTGESQTLAALAGVLGALHRWSTSLTAAMLVQLTLRTDTPPLLLEWVGPASGKSELRASLTAAQDALTLLERQGLLPHVSRILLSRDRSDIVADIGKRAAYLIDLNAKTIAIAPSAGGVPEPRVQLG